MNACDVIDEIEARDPEFFDKVVLSMRNDDFRAAIEAAFPEMDAGAVTELGESIWRSWAERGLQLSEDLDSTDPIALELLRNLRDMTFPNLFAPVGSPQLDDAEAVLMAQYRQIAATDDRIGAFVRKRGGRPLLLINALGVPIGTWARFLGGDHDFQVIVPVLPSYDLFAGGMTESSSGSDIADMISGLLGDLNMHEVDVLAWCNGGRVGVELLRRSTVSLGTLVLLSPTFRGGTTPSGRTSAYEDSLEKLFSMVAAKPARAASTAMILGLPRPKQDWGQYMGRPRERAQQLFSMPRRDFAGALVRPMVDAVSLGHYVRRTYSDEALSGQFDGVLPSNRVVLIQGSDDGVVDNEQTREWLEQVAPGATCFEITGAGHYSHDLQYGYLAHLLARVLGGAATNPALPSRVSISTGGVS